MKAPRSFRYTVCTKDEKSVNFLNLQKPFNLSVNAMDFGEAFPRKSPLTLPYHRATMILQIGFQYLIVHKRMTPRDYQDSWGTSSSKQKAKRSADSIAKSDFTIESAFP